MGQFYLGCQALRTDPFVLLVVLIIAIVCKMLLCNLQALCVVSRDW